MRLILWDIDGTLITSARAGERALIRALKSEFSIEGPLERVELAGRTDRYIAEQIFALHSIENTHDNIHRFFEAYLGFLGEELHNGPAVTLPGVTEVLERLAGSDGVAQGLLTGNIARGAQIKLEHFDVWHYFPYGAFADDSAIRNELGPHALRRASEFHDFGFSGADVVVVGDTPYDIECGKAIGAATVAVATGQFSAERLLAHNPDLILRDFRNPRPFYQFLGLD
ncbi:MAG: HAD family hydrolase [Opitutaceae bacterium]